MKLKGKKVAFLVEDGFEDLEFWVPLMRLQEEGAQITVVSDQVKEFNGKHGLQAHADKTAQEISAGDFDAIVVPGGWAPDKLRRYQAVRDLVHGAYKGGKIVAAICHAGLVLISAGVVRGHRATGSEGIKDDLINAGAEWVDKPAFRDGNLVWGRVVADIPDFCRELISTLSE